MHGPGSSVSIVTGYGLDGPGIESRLGPDFPHLSRPTLGPPSFLYNWYRVFPGGKEQPGRDADPSPPSSAVGHEIVELYLYSPYGPYGLYRASAPVQRWVTFTFYMRACVRVINHYTALCTTPIYVSTEPLFYLTNTFVIYN
jgi:hypothetical protein